MDRLRAFYDEAKQRVVHELDNGQEPLVEGKLVDVAADGGGSLVRRCYTELLDLVAADNATAFEIPAGAVLLFAHAKITEVIDETDEEELDPITAWDFGDATTPDEFGSQASLLVGAEVKAAPNAAQLVATPLHIAIVGGSGTFTGQARVVAWTLEYEAAS